MCSKDAECWMDNKFLQLNDKKTEIIIFGPSNCENNIAESLGPVIRMPMSNKGVDTELKINCQINSVMKNSFFKLQNIT